MAHGISEKLLGFEMWLVRLGLLGRGLSNVVLCTLNRSDCTGYGILLCAIAQGDSVVEKTKADVNDVAQRG